MELSKSTFGAILATLCLGLSAPALAQTAAGVTSAPTPAPAAGALDIKGFRSAAFGMTPAQVRMAIAYDFGATTKITEGANAVDGTSYLLATVDRVEPGPGPAQIGYVFGAASKTLGNINVIWTLGQPTDDQRAALLTAGQQLVGYFQAGPAPLKVSQGAAVVGPNAMLLYTAIDKKNAGVQVSVDGVSVPAGPDKTAAPAAPPKGPAALRIAYAQNIDKPDVKTLKPRSF